MRECEESVRALFMPNHRRKGRDEERRGIAVLGLNAEWRAAIVICKTMRRHCRLGLPFK